MSDPFTQTPPDTAVDKDRGISRRVIIAPVAVFVVLLVGVVAVQWAVDGAPSAEQGEAAPDVTFETWDGGSAELADFRGQPIVLNFFASWCAPCVQEMPAFELVHQQLGDDVAFVGLNVADRDGDGRLIVEETGITYDLGRDVSGEILRLFNEFGTMPTTAFIRADGSLAEVHAGVLTTDSLTEMIQSELLS